MVLNGLTLQSVENSHEKFDTFQISNSRFGQVQMLLNAMNWQSSVQNLRLM